MVWWSVDHASYAGTAPGARIGRGIVAGVPDLFVLHRGIAHMVEIKTEADDRSLVRVEVWCPLEKFYVVKAQGPRSEKQHRAQAIGMVARAVKDARGARVGDLAYRSGRRSRQECW